MGNGRKPDPATPREGRRFSDRKLLSYEKIFDESVCASIWNTGKMTSEYQKDDDKIPEGRQFEST